MQLKLLHNLNMHKEIVNIALLARSNYKSRCKQDNQDFAQHSGLGGVWDQYR